MVEVAKASAPPLIRLAHPQAFAAFLDHIGAPSQRHFRRQGLPVHCERPDAFVPLQSAWSLFHAAAQSEDPMLGWYVGRFVGEHNLNATLLGKLENTPTLYQALKKLIELVSAEASHLRLGILERRDDVLFYTHYPDRKAELGYAVSQAYQLEVYLDLVRHFVGRQWVPDEIGIEQPTVPPIVRDHFPGSRIRTHQRVGYIAIPRSCLHMAAQRANAEVGNDSLRLTQGFDFVDTLSALLETYVMEGYPSARSAAKWMDTSKRTLARRLSARGLTYHGLVDEVRFNAARKLLRVTDAPITDVATSVGFDDPSHFSRMFRRIGGLSPREFRNVVQGGETGPQAVVP